MNTNPPPLKKPRLRWWRLLGCLFLSLFLWWGVGKLLEPRPLWTIDSTEGKGVQPLVEQENGPYLLAAEFFHKGNINSRTPLALLVIDKQSGQVLHRMATSDPNLLQVDQVNTVPRIDGNVIWRLAITANVTGFEYRLCAWRYKEEETEKTVHLWQEQLTHQMRLQWPGKSKIVLIHRQQKSLESKVWNSLVNFLLSLSFGVEFKVLFPELPPWFETWQLPETPDQKLQRLCRWPVPANRIEAAWEMSEDGKRVVMMEPPGNSGLARQRALASGKQLFQGKDLYELFRADARGMQIFDTSTGACLHHCQDEYVPYVSWGWRGSYLITGVVNSNHITEELTLTDLLRRDIEWIPSRVDLLKPFQRCVYRIDEHGIQPVNMTTDYRNSGVQFAFHGGIFQGLLRTWKTDIYSHLRIDQDQLIVLNEIQFPRSPSTPGCPWLPVLSGQQYVTSGSNALLYYLKSWRYKWRWLERIYDYLEKHPWFNQPEITVFDASRQQSFIETYIASQPQSFSMLFLRKLRMQDVNIIHGSTLRAYELPMHIPSPWWARVAALIPWLWLIRIRFRSSRQK